MTTDEVESHQKKPKQQEEPSQDARPPSPEDEQLRLRNRNSAGRGLSRLFSSFLKRRSQCESEGGDRGNTEEEEAKAPIADPEPELRVEGEVALDQHSVSSTEAQVEKKEAEEDKGGKEKENSDEKGEEVVTEKEEDKEKESGPEGEEKGEKKEKTSEVEAKPPRAPRRPKTMQIKVTLLDDTLYECELDKHAKGQELFMKVCDHLNLLEKDYYGLAIWETPTMKTWMDLTKEIRRQVQGANYNFTFNVKFYPPDPAQLSEDITRYYLCLQLRKDILQGRLPCSFVTLALLGSYALQSELGEYDPEVHGNEYAKEMKMAQGQTKELEDKMMELHHTYRSMTPAQADLMFLENAKKLSMYGVDLHQAKDLDGVDIMLGVCSGGLMVYKDKLRINRFPWPKVLKVSYKRSSFFIKIRPSEVEQYESAIGFKLPNYKAAKKLWKVCVEHHTFFRLTSTEMATTPRKFLALGSKFRYSGRTQAQTRQASSLIDRPAPLFQRTSSKRNSRSLDGVSPGEATPSPLLHRHDYHDGSTPRSQRYTDRKVEVKAESKPEHTKSHSPKPESTPEIKTVARRERRHSPSVTGGERKSQGKQHSLQDKKLEMVRVRKKRAKRLEGETIYIRHSNLMLEDLDKTQTEIMRHHTSISELKRSFMESVPEPRPSEWDKRLSTNSPLRSVSINGQLQPASPVLKTQTVTISDVTNSLRGTVTYKDIPLVHTETKTITYESSQPVDSLAERDSGVLLSAQTITSETISTTTTTQITKTVKGGISETRIEKRIVITGDTEIDHDKISHTLSRSHSSSSLVSPSHTDLSTPDPTSRLKFHLHDWSLSSPGDSQELFQYSQQSPCCLFIANRATAGVLNKNKSF
ncbi:protein 4.1 isoform X3 [Melanotaenia boesemani]|uniref:protein 4.1 isoform X3 n=1 Tax=Melanotaenia boesemani TaxID=1250792 RepID=UPI001C04DC77|nr:protein 4.1 isoform X3 [Melanotaenia boesemani]